MTGQTNLRPLTITEKQKKLHLYNSIFVLAICFVFVSGMAQKCE